MGYTPNPSRTRCRRAALVQCRVCWPRTVFVGVVSVLRSCSWPVRQIDRQISSQFYEGTALSRNKAAMPKRGQRERPEDIVLPQEEVKDLSVLKFLDLKDEYSKSEFEESLVRHLEVFLMELGGEFRFFGDKRRLHTGENGTG